MPGGDYLLPAAGAVLLLGMLTAAVRLVVSARRTKYRALDLVSPSEAEFFSRLAEALPGGWHVFPQVAMSALIEPSVSRRSKDWAAHFREICTQRVDYVVCNERLQPRLVIELDDRSHLRKRTEDRRRDARLASAGLPTVRYSNANKPSRLELAVMFTSIRLF